MKQCLVDVNIWLALLVRQHEYHALARTWFDGLGTSQAVLCRIVQVALIRLLGNRSILGDDAVSASVAWGLVEELLEDERVIFAGEPSRLDSVLPKLLKYPGPTGKLLTDAYLAAFAIGASYRVVTLDQGFRQFRSLEVELFPSDRS